MGHQARGQVGDDAGVRGRELAGGQQEVGGQAHAEDQGQEGTGLGRYGKEAAGEGGQDEQGRRAGHDGLHQQVPRQQGGLPQVAALGLREEEGGIDGRQRGQHQARPEQPGGEGRVAQVVGEEVQADHPRKADEDKGPARQPGAPLGANEDGPETLGPVQVPDQEGRGERGEDQRQQGHQAGEEEQGRQHAQRQAGRGQQEGAGPDGLGDEVGRHLPVPGHPMGGGISLARRDGRAQQRAGHGAVFDVDGAAPIAGTVFGPGGPQQPAILARRGGDDGALFGVNVEELGLGALLGLAHAHRLRGQGAGDLGERVVQVAGQDGVLGADDDTGRLQAHLGAVRAEVALGRGVGVGVNVDGVVGAGLHAGLAADAGFGVELHNAVGALIHGRGGADVDAGRVGAVVAARHLEEAAGVGEGALLHVLHPGAVNADRHLVLRLAGGGAGVTADALAVVNDKAEVHRLDNIA